MLPSLLLFSVVAVNGAAPPQVPEPQRIEAVVGADQIAAKKPPVQSPSRSRNPFARLFREPETPPVSQLDLKPQDDALLQQNPTIECGLVVWHVDAKADPRIRIVAPRPDVDQKIAVRPPAPCTRNR